MCSQQDISLSQTGSHAWSGIKEVVRITSYETKMMMMNVHLIYAKYCSKCLTWTNSFTLHHNPVKLDIIVPFL